MAPLAQRGDHLRRRLGDLRFSLLLAVFLLIRGRIPLKEGFSWRRIERFSAVERANHWVTAASFLVIALSGLVLLYGRFFLKPWMGATAYSALAAASAYVHMIFMVPFVFGVLVMSALVPSEHYLQRRPALAAARRRLLQR